MSKRGVEKAEGMEMKGGEGAEGWEVSLCQHVHVYVYGRGKKLKLHVHVDTILNMCGYSVYTYTLSTVCLCAASGGATAGGGASAGVEIPPLMVEGKPHLPFQLQIEYTGRDGSRCMRVITQAKPITTDRGVAERGIARKSVV